MLTCQAFIISSDYRKSAQYFNSFVFNGSASRELWEHVCVSFLLALAGFEHNLSRAFFSGSIFLLDGQDQGSVLYVFVQYKIYLNKIYQYACINLGLEISSKIPFPMNLDHSYNQVSSMWVWSSGFRLIVKIKYCPET